MNFVAGAFLLARIEEESHSVKCYLDEIPRYIPSDSPKAKIFMRGESLSDLEPGFWIRKPTHSRIERDVYWLMAALISGGEKAGRSKDLNHLCLKELWLPGVPEMKFRVFQFDRLLEKELPLLYSHFKNASLQLEVLVSQWLLTLFAYSLPPNSIFKTWDLIFFDGWKGVFKLGIARLKAVESQLISMEIEEMSKFLRGFRSASSLHGKFSPWLMLQQAEKIKVTRSILNQLQQDFAVRLVREHLEGGDGEWLLRYAPKRTSNKNINMFLDSSTDLSSGVEAAVRGMILDENVLSRLRKEIESVSGPIAGDVAVFQCKIVAASIRHDEGKQLCINLKPEVKQLEEEVEELKEREQLLMHQMQLLLQKLSSPCFLCPPFDSSSLRYTKKATSQSNLNGHSWDVGSNLRNLASLVTFPIRKFPLAPTSVPHNQTSSRSGSTVSAAAQKMCLGCETKRNDMDLYRAKLDEVKNALSQRECRLNIRKLAYVSALEQVEDAAHLKAVLSAQMLQMMHDGEEKVEGQLRQFAKMAQEVGKDSLI